MKQPAIVLVLALATAVAGLSLATAQGGRKFTVPLTGAAEVPGPGDSDATGTAMLTINGGTGEVCFAFTATGLDSVTMAHIHRGTETESGPVVVTLPISADSMSADTTGRPNRLERCVSVPRDTVQAILRNLSGYYVNVHTVTFPDGAIRGQLAKKGQGKAGKATGTKKS